jgi:hypothetical protein
MSDSKQQLTNIVLDLINDRQEQARVAIHDYIVAKTQEVVQPEMQEEAVETE